MSSPVFFKFRIDTSNKTNESKTADRQYILSRLSTPLNENKIEINDVGQTSIVANGGTQFTNGASSVGPSNVVSNTDALDNSYYFLKKTLLLNVDNITFGWYWLSFVDRNDNTPVKNFTLGNLILQNIKKKSSATSITGTYNDGDQIVDSNISTTTEMKDPVSTENQKAFNVFYGTTDDYLDSEIIKDDNISIGQKIYFHDVQVDDDKTNINSELSNGTYTVKPPENFLIRFPQNSSGKKATDSGGGVPGTQTDKTSYNPISIESSTYHRYQWNHIFKPDDYNIYDTNANEIYLNPFLCYLVFVIKSS